MWSKLRDHSGRGDNVSVFLEVLFVAELLL